MDNNKLSLLLNYIFCPECKKSDFKLFKNKLVCQKCYSDFPIKEGILILVRKKQQVEIKNLWEKKQKYDSYVFHTTKKISNLVRNNTSKNTISLDVGCGVGAYQKAFNGTVISFDYIPYFLKIAAKKNNKINRIFLIADANDFPFKNNSFDFELCSQVIEHFTPENSEKLFKNMIRTVKNIIITDTPNDGNAIIHLLRIMLYRGNPNELHDEHETDHRMLHHKLMSGKDFEKFGFKVRSCIGFVTRDRFKWGILWDIYDKFVWYFPAFGGNLIGIYRKVKNHDKK